jgi:hypothetical protein
MNPLAYLWSPAEILRKSEGVRMTFALPCLVFGIMAVFVYLNARLLGSLISSEVLGSLSSQLTSEQLDQLRLGFSLSTVSSVINSFWYLAIWGATSIFLTGWIMFVSGKAPFGKLACLNALAFSPLLLHAVLVYVTMLVCLHFNLISFEGPLSIYDMEAYAHSLTAHPVILSITRTAYIADVLVSFYLYKNLRYVARLSRTTAIAGVSLCVLMLASITLIHL